MKVAEVAEALGVTTRTVQTYMKMGVLRGTMKSRVQMRVSKRGKVYNYLVKYWDIPEYQLPEVRRWRGEIHGKGR